MLFRALKITYCRVSLSAGTVHFASKNPFEELMLIIVWLNQIVTLLLYYLILCFITLFIMSPLIKSNCYKRYYMYGNSYSRFSREVLISKRQPIIHNILLFVRVGINLRLKINRVTVFGMECLASFLYH